MGPTLVANGLWKVYPTGEGTVEAVRGVSLSLNRGDMVAIMGASGCGKTTLLNMLSGIDEPSAGSVEVQGHALFGVTDRQRTALRAEHFGFIFQDFNLLPVLSARENVELPLLLGGLDPGEAKQRALQALDRVGLADRAEHRPAELSGGQQQRVAVARAIVHRPAVILCDEPTGNLDSGTSKAVMRLLKTLNEHEQTAFLIVTHDPHIAEQCQRIVTMHDGTVVSDTVRPHEEE